MKIKSLLIENFRGIKKVQMSNLKDTVIIAGQNGSGKSCIFDAIRLLKSIYGGYQQNELQLWMGEFQINAQNVEHGFIKIFNDKSKAMTISCVLTLSESEKEYIKQNSERLLKNMLWKQKRPEAYHLDDTQIDMLGAQNQALNIEINAIVNEQMPSIANELTETTIKAFFSLKPSGEQSYTKSMLLQIIFSLYNPSKLGVIEYHGAQRYFNREGIPGINMSFQANEQQKSQFALYNYVNKYNNVKNEIASSYIRELLSKEAGKPIDEQRTLAETLKSLFETFFPNKKFLGAQATPEGTMIFPVRIGDDDSHDIDDLSAGEKEIIYGYLRLKNSVPTNSIILMDEPELHLNPKLTRALPEFYRKNLGEEIGNQIWLVTHSDALLREVVGKDNYGVYHIMPSYAISPEQNQITELTANDELKRTMIDLVGDLAAFNPNGKIVIIEGGGESDFDKSMILRLFPELSEQANLISGNNKNSVKAMYSILDKACLDGTLPFKIYCITDNDNQEIENQSVQMLDWGVYHIENFLLNKKYIKSAFEALRLGQSVTEDEIWERLKECANETMRGLIRHELESSVYKLLSNSISLKIDQKATDISGLLYSRVESSIEKINKQKTEITQESLTNQENEIKEKYEQALKNNNWLMLFEGREILKVFTNKYSDGKFNYEVFRNSIIDKMASDGYKPQEMQAIINKILDD